MKKISGFIEQEEEINNETSPDGTYHPNKHLPGKITETIGRGEDAKNSFVYLTLKWAFIVGISITILLVVNNWFFKVDYKVPNLTDDIVTIWKIVVPLITLALGYAFGKAKD